MQICSILKVVVYLNHYRAAALLAARSHIGFNILIELYYFIIHTKYMYSSIYAVNVGTQK